MYNGLPTRAPGNAVKGIKRAIIKLKVIAQATRTTRSATHLDTKHTKREAAEKPHLTKSGKNIRSDDQTLELSKK